MDNLKKEERAGNEPNQYSHFYLYAKGWYKRGDMFEDLKVLLGNYSGTDPKHLSKDDVITFLSGIVSQEMTPQKFENFFRDMISDIRWHPEKTADIVLTENFLRVLDMAVVKGRMTLAKPDGSILPLEHSIKL